MNQFNIFKADRVVCDQTFTVQDIETNIPIRIPLLADAKIDTRKTQVKVTVKECDLRIDKDNDLFFMDLELFIVKQIVILQAGSSSLGSELSFNLKFPNLKFTVCHPHEVPEELFRRLHCQIFDVQAEENLTLNNKTNTFNETLTVTLVVKIVFEDQIQLPTPTPPTPPTPPPPVPPEVLTALEILAGKIRAQIGNQALKKILLQQIAKVENLLLSGQILEAMIIVSFIANELQQALNITPSLSIQINLVLADLNILEQELKAAF